ncbi:LysE family translocator [Pseudomonas sp. RIT-PI-S]|uniref:LysE family translocator n=1 Tax=Pseudomonas sp. RIT-PI-S TaxID=3035295 RepID=UPI0021D9BDF0|nr:LysE family translocator [Pseudomonas sp. RIT-PI-S]
MALHLWITFSLAYLATTLTPGPNVLLTVANALRYGPAAMAATFVGNLSAQLVVTTAVALGVGAMLVAVPMAFMALKLLGAGYLIYLGLRQLFARRAPAPAESLATQGARSNRRICAQAFLVSASNPKAMIFLCAFLPQFIEAGRPVFGQFVVMYLSIAAIVLTVHSTYCYIALRFGQRLKAARWLPLLKRGTGAVFVGLGVRLLSVRAA